MLSVPGRVFVAAEPVDMRKGFPGLSAIVREQLGEDPQSGDAFCFVNRRGDRVKTLVWDRNGFAIFYKQLARGRFRLPRVTQGVRSMEVTSAELAMLLDGADLTRLPRSPAHRSRDRLHYDVKTRRFSVATPSAL